MSRSIDSKREEFRKYLENAGVTDTITRILTMIYENAEKPADPLQFLRDEIQKSSPALYEQRVNDSAKERIERLEAENDQLKKELANYKNNAFCKSRTPMKE